MISAPYSHPSLWFRVLMVSFVCCLLAVPLAAQETAFKQAVAEGSMQDPDLSLFYKERGFQGIWTGDSAGDRLRRTELVKALRSAGDHGLPEGRYDLRELEQALSNVRSPREHGLIEVRMSRAFLKYARDVQTGVLVPSRIDDALVRQVPYRDRKRYLSDLIESAPRQYFRALPPQTAEYTALMKHKMTLDRLIEQGGWGAQVRTKKLEAGSRGPAVVALRDRLVRMGYLERNASPDFDAAMIAAVKAFQSDHGLLQDGVVGAGTLKEINVSAQDRLKAVIVAMERERWTNTDRGERHIDVNLADFSAKIIDGGKVTFETRAVVGHREKDRQSPEFSDVMEFMVVNPSWYVPRSIMTKEYLPELQEDPYAVNHIEITDRTGRVVDRSAVDFTQFDANTFPFAMRQPPSRGNALGLVKFMFPNKHNIYLHDTPAKNLFGREVRAYSHGCIRLADPFDFAYALLSVQSSDPEATFKRALATGKEVQIDLKKHVPVHIMYRTALADGKGRIQYRRDVYKRDAKIWNALSQAGVALRSVQG